LQEKISYKRNGAFKTHSFNDIISLKYFATLGHSSKRGRWEVYPFDEYRFYKIEFIDGTKLYATCLLIHNIEFALEPLLGIEAHWKFRVFPFLY